MASDIRGWTPPEIKFTLEASGLDRGSGTMIVPPNGQIEPIPMTLAGVEGSLRITSHPDVSINGYSGDTLHADFVWTPNDGARPPTILALAVRLMGGTLT